ncbi:head-to-tail adaptor [Arthrobacter phage Galaxy]|uniref:Head-to-tail adaptor n=1 Tax=Arthrobacter phage Galaxy TaxID=1772326 RepID=A0A0U4IU52_9CAUD|nr:head-to-tail connector [Arthrobacter phage Galaxy]ALY08855.1 head-to-tail adaptor [Arthrobacter phage Galaxy]
MTTTIVEPEDGAFRLPPLVTPEEFSAWTNGKIAANDPRVEPLLRGASAGVRRYCGWHIAPVLEETLDGDGPGGRLLILPTGRLLKLLTVDNGGEAVDPAAVDKSKSGMLELRAGAWSSRLGSVSVRVRHGYDVADVADVAQIIKQVTANALASPMGATREQAGQVSISWATTAPGVSGGLTLLERDLAVLSAFKI